MFIVSVGFEYKIITSSYEYRQVGLNYLFPILEPCLYTFKTYKQKTQMIILQPSVYHIQLDTLGNFNLIPCLNPIKNLKQVLAGKPEKPALFPNQ